MKKLISLVAACLVAGALVVPAPSASAASGGPGPIGSAHFRCQVTFQFPGSGATSCGAGVLPGEGTATGAFVPAPVCIPLCPFSASVDSYGETCIGGEPPLAGTAVGTGHIGTFDHDFVWTRVGRDAVITSADGSLSGHASFTPVPPVGTCANPNPAMVAHVAGFVKHI